MPLTSIGGVGTGYITPFNYVPSPVVMEVKINYDFTPTVEANFDFQGVFDYKISLDGQ